MSLIIYYLMPLILNYNPAMLLNFTIFLFKKFLEYYSIFNLY